MDPIVFISADRLRWLIFTCFEFDSPAVGRVMDLSDSTTVVTMKLRAQGTTTLLQTITCTKLFGGYTGMVRLDWPADSLDLDGGRYEMEVSADFDGLVLTAGKYWTVWDTTKTSKVGKVKIREDF